ncbi:preprotein translocase subunit SecE [Amycolatopsis sp. PS_44_ISF1]|uniref:preprotein translocase subunit SecE n=1 Tax=Amycolatopsis sp. PS_44_ISF1 TaxID=2974917 RepID=UPI0028DE357B|nr:preprotein translocase subunit SecE [Amycolatopsis sp. PS_44_ISF1]MDT8909811.1 preprotein translocase subunit SecE [Amycolatopsis sp. PS_44_ISF1]
MSDSDASGEHEQDESGQGPGVESRPVSAAARRERRASARPSGKSEARPEGKNRPAGKAGDKVAKSADTKGTPTPKRDQKAKKPSVFARIVRFIREVWAELRKVIWPNRKQMVTYTAVVLVFVVFMVALVSGLDLGFKQVIGLVFG